MVPSRVAGLLAQSSPSSGIYFHGDEHSQSVLSSPFGSSSDSLIRHSNKGAASEDINAVSLNSVGASSMVTDANSAFSGGPNLQRSASINNTESYSCLPTSPLSFTSNNISISSSSIMDGSSVVHHNSQQDQTAQQIQKTQQQGNPSASSFPQNSQLFLPMSGRIPGSLMQDPNSFSHVQKKPRIDIKQEDIIQQQVLQQLLRPDSMQIQNRNPQLHAILQQQRLRQQQQILQSMPHLQRAHLQQHQQQQQQQQQQQHQQQLQLRQQMQQQGMQPMNALKRPNDSGVCARRLMQYLYHQRQRPPDNAIAYWRKFVAEYYSPRAKKRWCLSLYENVGQHALGVFPQAAMDAWQCDICNSKSGRGFEATFEVLPRLNEIKFGSGVIDELLFLDLPKEYRTTTGLMVLEYAKAVQESVHEQLRVVREGHLRIVFAQDLKILSWEFCARRHEELLSRRLVAPQVNQLLQVAQKCNNAITEAGADGISSQDVQTSSNMVQPAWRQLAKTVELQSLNDLGFSKRYVRCLQISEVVNSMKDLIDLCRDKKSGPIDGLKNYPRHASTAKLETQEMEQKPSIVQGIRNDQTINKLMGVHQNTVLSNNNHMISRGAISGTPQASYQNMLSRQNSMNPTRSPSPSPSLNPNNSVKQEMPCSNMKQLGNDVNGYSSPQLPPHHPTRPSNNLTGTHQQNNSPQPSTSNVSGGTVSRNNSFKEAVTSNGDSSGPAAGGTNSRTQDLQPPPPQDDILSDIVQEFTDSGFFSGDFDDAILGFNWK